jgi:hypothetical protein
VSDRKRIRSYLVCRGGGGRERIVVWDTIDIQVGRRKTQDIVVSDPEVSREHAVFRKHHGRHVIEDLGTAIGTLVNGQRITEHELQPGDVIQIGTLEMAFGQTAQQIRPDQSTCFASELKTDIRLPEARGAGGRTVLGFNAEDSFLSSSAPTAPPPELAVARGLATDGTLEEIDDDPLGLSIDSAFTFDSKQARDPDHELQLELELKGLTPELESVVTALRGRLLVVPPVKIHVKKSSAR